MVGFATKRRGAIIKRYTASHPGGIGYRSKTPFSEADIMKFVNGYSLKFVALDGSEVNAGDLCAFEYTDSFSLTGWLKIETGFNSGTLLARMGTDAGWRLRLDTAVLYLDLIHDLGLSDMISCHAPTALDINEWYFWGATYDGGNVGSTGMKFYLAGALDGCTSISESVTGTIIEPSINLMMGEDFTGWQDEMGIYDGVLTAPEMANLFATQVPRHLKRFSAPSPSQLRHWWRMGDSFTAPDQMKDEVTGNYATIVNATRDVDVPVQAPPPLNVNLVSYWKCNTGPWVVSSPLVDEIGNAALTSTGTIGSGAPLVADGTFSASSTAVANFTGPANAQHVNKIFSFQAWFQRSVTQTGTRFLYRMFDTGTGVWFCVQLTSGVIYIVRELNTYAVGSILAPTHLVVVSSVSGLYCYLNGSLVITHPPFVNAPVLPMTISIGGTGTTNRFNGRMDEYAFWAGRNLTPTEVTTLWNGGTGQPITL